MAMVEQYNDFELDSKYIKTFPIFRFRRLILSNISRQHKEKMLWLIYTFLHRLICDCYSIEIAYWTRFRNNWISDCGPQGNNRKTA